MNKQKFVIVGGVAGGASCAARLRRLDENCEIIIFEKGEYISFANCALPYYIGGEITEKSSLTAQTPQSFKDRFNVDVHIFNEVTEINRQKQSVTVKNHKTGEVYNQSYDKLILSMGSEPIKLPIKGIDSDKVFTLRNIPDTFKIKNFIDQHKPKTAAVVGGGYIGVEMAENLHNAGILVTIIEMQNQLIAPLDFDMTPDINRYIQSQGINLILGDAVNAINETNKNLQVVLNNNTLEFDMLIMAIGVKAESKIAKSAGIETNERGAIVVDNTMLTNDKNIYAVGDTVQVTDFVTNQNTIIPLAGPANKQGRVVADNICKIKSTYTGTQGSAILKLFDMTIATTGINEKTAKKLNLDYDKSFNYPTNHASYYPNAVSMSIKTIYEKKTGKILGTQIVGFDGVDKRCDVIATAIRFGATASDLAKLELCYSPPYSSAKDPVNMVGFTIENIINKKVKIFHWHDIENLHTNPDIILLDTRTKIEYQNGHIKEFINIPLDDLRDRLTELDKSKKIYVTCQAGLRGYIACRILSQNDFDCYNLSGGYKLYSSILANTTNNNANTNTNNAKENLSKKSNSTSTLSTKDSATSYKIIKINACGLQCPGPIVKLSAAINESSLDDIIEISTTDPAFSNDLEGFCRSTGNILEGITYNKGICTAKIRKSNPPSNVNSLEAKNGKNFIVFSGDLDKAIASFIMANASAALSRKTSMFFTFWGLNILRKQGTSKIKKDFISKMFGLMMPKGSTKLGLSKMNMGGIGPKMIRNVMKNKNVDSLEDLICLAQKNNVEILACSMSMDVMGIKSEELIDGVKLAGAAAMIAHAEESDMSLFI